MPASSIRKKVSEVEAWFTTPTTGNYNPHNKIIQINFRKYATHALKGV